MLNRELSPHLVGAQLCGLSRGYTHTVALKPVNGKFYFLFYLLFKSDHKDPYKD